MIEILEDGLNLIGLDQPGDQPIFCIYSPYMTQLSHLSDGTIRTTLRKNWFSARECNALISYCHKIREGDRAKWKNSSWMLTPIKKTNE